MLARKVTAWGWHLPRHRPGSRRPDLGGKPPWRRSCHQLHLSLESQGPAISYPIFPVRGQEERKVSGSDWLVLVVEDEAPIRRFLKTALEA
jgi:hypothetical protein